MYSPVRHNTGRRYHDFESGSLRSRIELPVHNNKTLTNPMMSLPVPQISQRFHLPTKPPQVFEAASLRIARILRMLRPSVSVDVIKVACRFKQQSIAFPRTMREDLKVR